MTAQAQWNELSHHHCLIHFSLFLMCLSLSLKMTALMTTSWEPLQSNLKQYIITVGLKAPSLQSNSSCMSSGLSNRMIALQAPPASCASSPTGSRNNSFGLCRIWGPAVSEELQHFPKDKDWQSVLPKRTVKGTGWALAGCVGSSRRHSTASSHQAKPGARTISPNGELAQSLTLLRALSGSREL